MARTSRFPGFYKITVAERRSLVSEATGVDVGEIERALEAGGLDAETADKFVENVLGVYALPYGVALNVRVNGRDHVVPMVVEEPSVVAAASNAAKMVRAGGGFTAEVDPPLMISQVQLIDVAGVAAAEAKIREHKAEILRRADLAVPGLVARGGGAREVEVRRLGEPADRMLAVHIVIDCKDAMGANLVNTVAEAVADRLAELAGARVGLRILTNLCDKRCVRVTCRVPADALATSEMSGPAVLDGIVNASRFAELDPYRAATHNKGIMNGVDAVVIASGNDWRAVEAGAHAFATRSGRYKPLAVWRKIGAAGSSEGRERTETRTGAAGSSEGRERTETRTGAAGSSEGRERTETRNDDVLVGRLEMPLALGTVGGTLRVQPGARLSLRLLGVDGAGDLAAIAAAVGLASNLAAVRALASDGIQRGHMGLHARSVAVAAGAKGALVEKVAALIVEARDITLEAARRALAVLETEGEGATLLEE
jgi:hydroxymethylglutaryl-CoA reductase